VREGSASGLSDDDDEVMLVGWALLPVLLVMFQEEDGQECLSYESAGSTSGERNTCDLARVVRVIRVQL
jgi:hypothetical protein